MVIFSTLVEVLTYDIISRMTNKIMIRKAKLEELNRVSYVTKIAYKSPFIKNGIVTKAHQSNELKEDFLYKKVGILVAVSSGKIVGVQKYKELEDKKLYIFQLAVLKTYRGNGIGTQLLKETEKIAKEMKLKMVVLDCMQEKHLPEYYETLGYKIDEVKKQKDYHMVYMSKVI